MWYIAIRIIYIKYNDQKQIFLLVNIFCRAKLDYLYPIFPIFFHTRSIHNLFYFFIYAYLVDCKQSVQMACLFNAKYGLNLIPRSELLDWMTCNLKTALRRNLGKIFLSRNMLLELTRINAGAPGNNLSQPQS